MTHLDHPTTRPDLQLAGATGDAQPRGATFPRYSVLLLLLALLGPWANEAMALTTPTIAAGGNHSCALRSDGKVNCWGINTWGQLGNGTTVSTSTPVAVSGLSQVSAIATGAYHTCALGTDGTVQCWGINFEGQLGNGTLSDASTPVSVSGLTGVSAITAGENHTCALKTDGTVWCWGQNSSGNLGNGAATTVAPFGITTPVNVTGLTDVLAIAAGGSHSCAVKADSTVQCWGYNSDGQLGSGRPDLSPHPTAAAVTGLTGVTQIAMGLRHGCALRIDGTVRCWGSNNAGQLGNGNTAVFQSTTPLDVIGLTGASAISAGVAHSCALGAAGTVRCWGQNSEGELGNGTTDGSATPVAVNALAGVSTLAAGFYHNCAIRTAGSVQCWGFNGSGQLGNGTSTNAATPVNVLGVGGAGFLNVTPQAQTIIFNPLPPRAVTSTPFTLSATASSGLAVSYSESTPGVCSVNGSNVTLLTQGICTIEANQPGNADYGSAPAVLQSFAVSSGLAAGLTHSCVVKGNGTVRCWGGNSFGQLGNGTTTGSTTPVAVAGVSAAAAITAGGNHTCVLKTDGTVQCWGENFYGQLGNGTNTDSTIPVPVTGLAGVVAIAAGSAHTCALKGDGTVHCWGANHTGQLGTGNTNQSSTPIAVSGLSGVSSIAAGPGAHTCAVTVDGTARCWGNNFTGQLGNGTTLNSSLPVSVSGLSNVNGIASGGSHTCALRTDATARCWGWNVFGQLGNGTTTFQEPLPSSVVALSGIGAVVTGDRHSCALMNSGTIQCWGIGALGNAGIDNSATPVNVTGSTSIQSIVAGSFHGCALKTDGTLICWGNNSGGQLGNGTLTNALAPVTVLGTVGGGVFNTAQLEQTISFGPLSPRAFSSAPFAVSASGSSGLPVSFSSSTPSVCSVSGSTVTVITQGTCTIAANQAGNATHEAAPQVTQSFEVFSALAAGLEHSCALRTDGSVQCWGRNASGQLGNGSTSPTTTPGGVLGLAGVSAIAAGNFHNCALRSDGTVHCWGANSLGQLGNGTTSDANVPVTVTGLTGVIALAAGEGHTCALKSDSTVRCWGANSLGQVGNGTTTLAAPFGIVNPVSVTGLSGVSAISAGGGHTCALKSDGTVQCWGQNAQGQLGNGTNSSATTPVSVTSLTGARAIAAGYNHTCAIGNDGVLHCWGDNALGQFGDGTTVSSNVPGSSAGITGISALVAGDNHTCALLTDGTVQCWGQNILGQLGNGTFINASTPVPVSGLSGVRTLAAGVSHSCALRTEGTLRCWGYNFGGQLGNGTTTSLPPFGNSAPTVVLGPGGVGVFNITPLPQTINFEAPSDQTVGAALILAASSSAGLPVSYNSLSPSVCTVNGNSVNLLAAGKCTITASQAGTGVYGAAPNVTQSFQVLALPQQVPVMPPWALALAAGVVGLSATRRR